MPPKSSTHATSASVANEGYRKLTLLRNGVVVRLFNEIIPPKVKRHVDGMCGGEDEKDKAVDLSGLFGKIIKFTAEMDQETRTQGAFMGTCLFEASSDDDEYVQAGLSCDTRRPLSSEYIPSERVPRHAISQPIPDVAYSYLHSRDEGGPGLCSRQISGIEAVAPMPGSSDRYYPFLVVEFKPDIGSICVAENQCAGGSSTCLAMVRRLNNAVARVQAITANAAAAVRVAEISYSAIFTNRLGQIMVTWYDGSSYQVQECASFLLTRLEELHDMHRCIRRIMDQVGAALDDQIASPPAGPWSSRPQRRSRRLRNKRTALVSGFIESSPSGSLSWSRFGIVLSVFTASIPVLCKSSHPRRFSPVRMRIRGIFVCDRSEINKNKQKISRQDGWMHNYQSLVQSAWLDGPHRRRQTDKIFR